jgi:hypothetical protein
MGRNQNNKLFPFSFFCTSFKGREKKGSKSKEGYQGNNLKSICGIYEPRSKNKYIKLEKKQIDQEEKLKLISREYFRENSNSFELYASLFYFIHMYLILFFSPKNYQ